MEQSEKNSFWKDFQFVKTAIENPNNKPEHKPILLNLIKALDAKWCFNYAVGLYNIPRCEAVYPLYDDLKLKF